MIVRGTTLVKKIGINIKKYLEENTDLVAIFLFVIFYSMPFFKWSVGNVLELVGLESLATPLILLGLYGGVFLLISIDKKYYIPDFFILLASVVIFFVLTYLFHPEYNYVYFRDDYGVLTYVLRPDNGIYAYLFVRMLGKPESLLKGLTVSALITFFYSVILFIFALERGFWVGENYLGERVYYSYDLNFGYNLVLPACTFFYNGMKKDKKVQLLFSIISIFMILIAGSRGPFLAISIFLGLYFLINFIKSENKRRYIVFFILVLALVIILTRKNTIHSIQIFLDNLGISSRTIDKILEGDIADGSGRGTIWTAAINHIKSNPLGSGAMGAREVLHRIHNVGHPHNFFLEIFIDYGIVLGSIFILAMLAGSGRVLFFQKNEKWKWVYLLFLAQAFTLLISYTYWHSTGIWGALGAYVSWMILENKKPMCCIKGKFYGKQNIKCNK
ncbi:MAG: O-antigen ligase family protein [Tissierellia bacterium]|nr:O-antigen ligase family protein [Tissierellia bacterium]